jgi:hypothetical protein
MGCPAVTQHLWRNAFVDTSTTRSLATCDPDGLVGNQLLHWQAPSTSGKQVELRLPPAPEAAPSPCDDAPVLPWRMRSPISIWRTQVGVVEVHYKCQRPIAWEGPFLREEQELLDNIAHRIGEYLEWKQRELGTERLGAAPEHWRWRQRFAERIAAAIDPVRFGVEAVYLFGSTELGNAGAGSDIDLIVVCGDDGQQKRDLQVWLEGWSLCLAEISFQLYGLPSTGLLDVRFLKPEQARAEVSAFAAAGKTLQALPLGVAAKQPKTQYKDGV